MFNLHLHHFRKVEVEETSCEGGVRGGVLKEGTSSERGGGRGRVPKEEGVGDGFRKRRGETRSSEREAG